MSDINNARNRYSKKNSQTSSSIVYNGEKKRSPRRMTDQVKLIDNDESHHDEEELNEDNEQISEDDDGEDIETTQSPTFSTNVRSINLQQEQELSSSKDSLTQNFSSLKKFMILPVIIIILIFCFYDRSDSSLNDKDWRLRVDPNNTLSDDRRFIVRASLKPILDKSSMREEGVSTLLILSSNEENAAKLARCILGLVNTGTYKDQVSTEIDLQSHRGGKKKLDSKLRTLLSPGDTIRAVLLRHIDNIPSDDAFEQLRLLFAYCDGENPVFPHRLIIMTATSNDEKEIELRETFKTRWPKEHDFVDALMSRISGHTLYIENDQKSIC